MRWTLGSLLLTAALALISLPALAFGDINIMGGSIINRKSEPLYFDTNNDGVMDIALDTTGKLGIGTTSPSANLHVAGNLSLSGNLHIYTSVQPPFPVAGDIYSDGTALYFYDGSSWDDLSASGSSLWGSASGNITLGSGRVGVGTAAPAANLHVMGNALVSEELMVSGQVFMIDGNATLPALAFSSDTDSGIFLSSAGNIAFAIAGTEVLAISSSNIQLRLDLQSDRWQESDTNTALGIDTFGDGGLSPEGVFNTAIGSRALKANTSGNQNTAIGYDALVSNTSGYNNTALGANALRSNTTGSENTAAGCDALQANTSGSFNVAVGDNALFNSVLSSYNTAVGFSALYSYNSAGGNNTAMGYCSLYSLTSGIQNTAVGSQSAFSATTADNLPALGYRALRDNSSGRCNTAVGANAMEHSQTGSYNSVVGCLAGMGVSGISFENNAILGYKAGYALTNGDNNVLLGALAGNTLTEGDNNIIIGYDQNTPSPTTDAHLNIGGLIYGDLSTGNIGIGVLSPTARLQVGGNVLITSNLSMGGNLIPSQNATFDLGSSTLIWNALYAGNTTMVSDRRLKEDIEDLDYGLDEILKLRPVSFAWKGKPEKGRRIGFIAQEVEAVIAEAVNTGPDAAATKGILYEGLVPVLIKALQEQQESALHLGAQFDRQQEERLRLMEEIRERHEKGDRLMREIEKQLEIHAGLTGQLHKR
ncbi:MAG: tail fiber domain-containing protein [Planctomycetes bacterium]|nr:tail fiber domain-containing protein [Planctomycetota bacterium]